MTGLSFPVLDADWIGFAIKPCSEIFPPLKFIKFPQDGLEKAGVCLRASWTFLAPVFEFFIFEE